MKETPGGAIITVRVQPGASDCAITVTGAVLRLRVKAPPVDGRANDSVVEAFAGFLGIRKSQVEILKGNTSRNKVIRIRGITACDVERRLARFLKEISGS